MSASTKREPIRLMETFHSLFYTPIYVALSGGFFQREGLDVQFSTCPPGYHGLTALQGGMADIVQTGPMRSIIAADSGAEAVPVNIIEINSRDGFFLVGRTPPKPFKWTALKEATLIPVGFSPMPKASLKYALKKKGVELAELRLVEGLSLQEAMDAFRRGEGDFVHVPQPSMEQLVYEGTGHLSAAIGPMIGPIAYSSFATTQGFISSNVEELERFTQGFYNAQKWLAEKGAREVAGTVSSFFPAVEKTLVERAVARYKEQDTWSGDPLIRENEFNTLQEVLMEAGLIKSHQAYERIVRTDFAQKAMRQEVVS